MGKFDGVLLASDFDNTLLNTDISKIVFIRHCVSLISSLISTVPACLKILSIQLSLTLYMKGDGTCLKHANIRMH